MSRSNHKKHSAPDGVRPLTSQALKSMIDTLRPEIPNAKILDLFSGTGRFGFRCLEEGCTSVQFVEKNRLVAAALRENGAEVAAQDAFKFLEHAAENAETFDLVFADPPFPIWTEPFSEELFTGVAKVLAGGGIFLVQHPKRVVAFRPVQALQPWKKTQFGESIFSYFRYETSDEK